VLGNLASLLFEAGRPLEACEYYARSLPLHRQVKNRRWEALTLCDVALPLLALGRVEEGKASWAQGLAQLTELKLNADITRRQPGYEKALNQAR
jgi:hypothetical protein